MFAGGYVRISVSQIVSPEIDLVADGKDFAHCKGQIAVPGCFCGIWIGGDAVFLSYARGSVFMKIIGYNDNLIQNDAFVFKIFNRVFNILYGELGFIFN